MGHWRTAKLCWTHRVCRGFQYSCEWSLWRRREEVLEAAGSGLRYWIAGTSTEGEVRLWQYCGTRLVWRNVGESQRKRNLQTVGLLIRDKREGWWYRKCWIWRCTCSRSVWPWTDKSHCIRRDSTMDKTRLVPVLTLSWRWITEVRYSLVLHTILWTVDRMKNRN